MKKQIKKICGQLIKLNLIYRWQKRYLIYRAHKQIETLLSNIGLLKKDKTNDKQLFVIYEQKIENLLIFHRGKPTEAL